ncbi:hypothetical protein ACWNY2_00685 [Candidatus Karelsulcia muelleri]
MKKNDFIILGIDTSCEETCAAILNNNTVLSNIVRTKTIPPKFGLVVPELDASLHLKILGSSNDISLGNLLDNMAKRLIEISRFENYSINMLN